MRGFGGGRFRRASCATDVFVGKDGFTTIGAAVAILLSCSLAFLCLWTARSQARAAGVQAACDTAALAAQNEVAEFVLAVRVADATLLTMSLTGLAALGIGTVCCCVPAAAPAGAKLIDAGKAIVEQRDEVARVEQRALNAAQDGLVLLAQSQAQAVLRENGTEIGGSGVGYVELVPEEAPEVEVGFSDAARDAAQGASEAQGRITEAGEAAEEAAREAADAKIEAWEHDCGAYPSPCMAERAKSLSAISDEDNPIALAVDAWSFSDALSRAKAYYEHRIAEERPASDSVDERVRSAMRLTFYEYALEELGKGRAVDDGISAPDIYFPELFADTDGMRETSLYAERAYPVADGALHAYGECPGIKGVPSGFGSLEELEAGMYATCSVCRFDADALGRVAAASTSIENGFEHHYREVARAARAYCEAQSRALPLIDEAKALVEERLDVIKEALGEVSSQRVEAYPPGRFGVVAAYVFDTATEPDASSFFEGPSDMGSFAAVSSAVMVEDSTENAMSSLLDGAAEGVGPPLSEAGDAVLGIWGSLLDAYGSGVEGMVEGVSGALDGLPLASASGLGEWAAGALEEVIASAGLEPVETAPPKPVIENSMHVASKGEGPLSQAICAMKEYGALPRLARRSRSREETAGNRGQMTVEAAVVLPVMAAIGFVLSIALVYVGDCAAFDIVAREAIRMQADDGYEGVQGAAEVRSCIEERWGRDYETVEVVCERTEWGHARYTASVELSPPFLRDASVFGIEAPSLKHEVSLTVSPYRKGVVI